MLMCAWIFVIVSSPRQIDNEKHIEISTISDSMFDTHAHLLCVCVRACVVVLYLSLIVDVTKYPLPEPNDISDDKFAASLSLPKSNRYYFDWEWEMCARACVRLWVSFVHVAR